MSFLYPQFLYGLFALTIPIIIHLFNFRRTKVVYFSNTQFLKKVKEASSSKLKLKHYLILLSRLLFIFFLVIAFAQPFVPASNQRGGADRVVIYLDNSYSMSNEMDENLSSFEVALSFVSKIISLYPTSTSFKLVTNDFSAYSNTYKSGKEIADLLTELSMSGVPRTVNEIYDRIKDKNDGEIGDVFWISDFQASTIGKESITIDSLQDLNIVPLNFTNANNVYIDSIYLDNPFMIGDQQVKLNVVVTNKGTSEVDDLGIKVFVDSVQSTTATMNIQPNDKKVITFDMAFDLNKLSEGKISIEEFPVTFDNDFYFVINNSKKISVLEIFENKQQQFIQGVFGNTQLFDYRGNDVKNLDYSLIAKAELVVINGLSEISSSLINVINQRIKNGGHLLIIPSAKPAINTYKSVVPISNVELGIAQDKAPLASPDLNNPFFSNVFEEKGERFVMPLAKAVLKLRDDRNAILKFQNGNPFLSQAGKGVYLMASPLSDEFTSLQSHAIFVPIMYRLAAESASGLGKLFYYVDDNFITFNIDSLTADNVFKLSNQTGELIPPQRVINKSVLIEIPKFALKAGFYNLSLSGTKISSVAFNSSPLESDLRQLEEPELAQFFKGKFDIINVTNETAFGKAIENKYVGEPYWKYAVMLALLFLFVEVLLIRFFP